MYRPIILQSKQLANNIYFYIDINLQLTWF